ncbi:MAG: putative zinc-binding metallopeptidase, partial [Phycisphaerales bacterium]
MKQPERPQRRTKTTTAPSPAGDPPWARLSDEELLDMSLRDLGLTIRGTVLMQRIREIYAELSQRDIRFRPHFWLSSEWFVADGVPGAAIPFYLAHPRLMELEDRQMLEVEGGTHEWCMRLLRHEVGHAIDNAYRLYRKRKWRQAFGKPSQPYPDYYQPRPYSRRFVLHLDQWYAQSHPTEDFAETFAVWLTPGSAWRKRYAGWPALKKLECVDALMQDIAGNKPLVVSRERVEPLSRLSTTLREHYAEKRARYGVEYPNFYDKDLRRLFVEDRGQGAGETAARFLRRVRPEIRKRVARWTGEYQYTIDQVLLDM